MRQVLLITKALADGQRLRALMALRGRELCLCQLTALTGLAPSTMSRHMTALRHAGLVQARKAGRWQYFRLSQAAEASPEIRPALAWLACCLEQDQSCCADQAELAKIVAMDPEELCRRQCPNP